MYAIRVISGTTVRAEVFDQHFPSGLRTGQVQAGECDIFELTEGFLHREISYISHLFSY